ncbi:beta-galactosidase [Nibricoccus sp. IMCC34717]|uniref:beta-galactosidase n=1 Tax=Nibricoccus sp. IMCC34717 TaxID=3034021 RepID=UPI00384F55AA
MTALKSLLRTVSWLALPLLIITALLPAAPEQPEAEFSATKLPLLFGAAYYDEYMPVERLSKDVELMRDAGMNVVRIGESTWSVLEPEDGVFDFAHIDRVLDAMHAGGIRVIVGTPTYSLPPWLARAHPEILLNGWNSYGFRQNMDIVAPAYRKYAERVIRTLVAHVKDHPAVIGFQLDNETKAYGNASANAQEAFIVYLKNKYNDLDLLNRAWGLNYWGQNVRRWEDMPNPAAASNPGVKLEWARFQRKMPADYLTWQAAIVRELKRPDQFITQNFDGEWRYPQSQVDQHSAARSLDIAGYDIYYSAQYAFDGADIAFHGDYARSLKRGKYLVMETTAQTNGWDSDGQYPPLDGQSRQAVLSHLASGAQMVEFWHWHSLHFGQETYWKGVLGHDLEPNRVYRELKRTGEELRRLEPEVAGFVPRPRAAILYSPDSQLALKIQPFSKNESYETIIRQMHSAMYRANVAVDIILPSDDLSRYALIVVPPLYIADDALCERLKTYVERGGHLVLGFKAAFCDEFSQVRHVRAPGPLAAVTGVSYQEFSSVGKIALRSRELAVDDPAASTWVEFLEPTTARILLGYDHDFFGRWPAVTENSFGKGEVIYEGTLLSDATQSAVLLRAAERSGVRSAPKEVSFPVIVREGTNAKGHRLRFIFNYSVNPVVSRHYGAEGRDLLSGLLYSDADPVQLPPWGCAVLDLGVDATAAPR